MYGNFRGNAKALTVLEQFELDRVNLIQDFAIRHPRQLLDAEFLNQTTQGMLDMWVELSEELMFSA